MTHVRCLEIQRSIRIEHSTKKDDASQELSLKKKKTCTTKGNPYFYGLKK